DEAARAVVPPDLLQRRRLELARAAPRREEVQDDRLAAEGRERQLPVAFEPRQGEGRRGPPDLRRRGLVREIPEEDAAERPHRCDRENLSTELQPAPHPGFN